MMKMLMRSRFVALLGLSVLLGLSTPPAVAQNKAAGPDFTKGGTVPKDAQTDWNLGATGARGYIHSERMSTTVARQVYITRVVPNSPAAAVLKPGDVLLGVRGEGFSYDPRVEIGKALTHAESDAGKGRFEVIRWRGGETQTVTIDLPVLGTYSKTAPYNCPKSKRIFERGCELLAEQMLEPNYRRNPTERSLNALVLLASGKKEYLPLIKREVKWASEFKTTGFATWWYGYTIMLVAEYTMQTGDQAFMPGLERLAMEAANGQSIVGSWGHRFAGDDGILMGYGMMNAPGLTLTTGLVLAREAGVKNPKLDLAIERAARLVRFYVDKGSIPYGDHHPWIQTHDDNGKNGIAAVLFNLLGDREAAEYYSRMSVASHGNERDGGHTGNYWNMLWAMPGVAQSGPNAAGAWMEEFGAWYYDSARTPEGGFAHQGPPGLKRDKYFSGWKPTGAYLLAYARPLKKLRLTGKGKSAVPAISRAEADMLVQSGRGWDNKNRNGFYDKLTDEQLLARLRSWSPIVRERAGMALGRRKADVADKLIKMLGDPSLYARYGACQGLKFCKVNQATAVGPLTKTLDAGDLWLRVLAADALASIGTPARTAVPRMLERLAMRDVKNDPRAMEQRYLSFALFNRRGGLIARSVKGIDQELLFNAIRAGLKNEDGRARGAFGSVYSQLSLEEIKPLLPAIYQAVAESAPSGIMFASGIRDEGLKILARHGVEEGMTVGMDYLLSTWNKWGSGKRNPRILASLAMYGANAKPLIPQLEALYKEAREAQMKTRHKRSNGTPEAIRATIDKIKASTKKRKLINIDVPRVG